ncbi:fec operon regulator FecR [compost metagenome]
MRFDKGRREIEVTRGEAYFAVARDAARPFVVKMGARSVRAGSGAFTVHRLDGRRSEVTIQSGDLQLDAAGADRPVGANARVVLGADGGSTLVGVAAREIDRSLAWREGRLAFEGETLAQAAAAFARYGGPYIRVADPGLALEPITGLFAANDPAGFSRAAALALDARVQASDEGLVIVR